MQAVLDVHALKTFTKALLCLSRYGDDLILHASSDVLALSATNPSKSAYCRFRLLKSFFSRYRLDDLPHDDEPHTPPVTDDVVGQVLIKSLLSVLKHKTLDKSVERCELHIHDSARSGCTTEPNDIESKLIIRMHCKHGVVKTHRLLLMSHGTLLAPSNSDQSRESRVVIGSKMLKEMIEHFPPAKGKSDPRLVWNFGETEVGVKSLDAGIDNKGKTQISTELTVNASEFDDYFIHDPPITIAYHLREFNATIAYADSMNLSLVLRFTDPAAPLYVDIDGENDSTETLFVISTSHVHGAPSRTANTTNYMPGGFKRDREERTVTPAPSKKLIRAVHPVDISPNASGSHTRAQSRLIDLQANIHSSHPIGAGRSEPLFLPLSPHTFPMMIDHPNAEQSSAGQRIASKGRYTLFSHPQDGSDEMELGATQSADESNNFHPLFED